MIDELINQVIEGNNPDEVINEATKGYLNAIKRQKNEKAKAICKECDYEMPSYPGKYPNKCPICGGPIWQPE